LANGLYAGDSLTIRQNNLLTFNTDDFGGFKGHGMFMMNNTNSNQTAGTYGTSSPTVTGGTNNYNGWGLGADYTYQKAFATAAYQSFSARNPYAALAPAAGSGTNNSSNVVSVTTSSLPTPALGTAMTMFGAGQGSLPGLNVRDNQWYAAATYDFGILKGYLQYVNRKITNSIDTSQYASRTGEQIGVRSFVTPVIEAWAQAGMGRLTSSAGIPAVNLLTMQVGSNYWLSKRTNLYAIYGQEASGTQTTGASSNVNNYAVGVRHTF
jgi:predicted porin